MFIRFIILDRTIPTDMLLDVGIVYGETFHVFIQKDLVIKIQEANSNLLEFNIQKMFYLMYLFKNSKFGV